MTEFDGYFAYADYELCHNLFDDFTAIFLSHVRPFSVGSVRFSGQVFFRECVDPKHVKFSLDPWEFRSYLLPPGVKGLIATEAASWTARWTLCEIGCVNVCGFSHRFFEM